MKRIHLKNKELFKQVAGRIKKLREEKNITQITAFVDTGINIGRLEIGNTNISLSSLYVICIYFDISLSDFFGGIKTDKQCFDRIINTEWQQNN
jgi:transcriptional regulator with XRE-family HTH domain